MSLFSRIITKIWTTVAPRVQDVIATAEDVAEHVKDAVDEVADKIAAATEDAADIIMGEPTARRRIADVLATDRAQHKAETGEDLDYAHSVVDLLKLINEDSSFRFRKQLAAEFGMTGYIGSAPQNEALAAEIMKRLQP